MKVLETENIDGWSYICDCTNCKSKLEIASNDLRHTYYESDGPHPSSDSYWVVCIMCNDTIHIPESSIPKLLQINVKRKSR